LQIPHSIDLLDNNVKARLRRSPAQLEVEDQEDDSELETLPSDAQSHKGSEDEWHSAISSEHESDYKPEARRRRKRISKKKIQRGSK
jgi:hypothetical protein